MKHRGLHAPRLAVGDGHLGIWAALSNVYPEVKEQRCWNHRVLNVLAKVPKRRRGEARELLTAIPYAETAQQAEHSKRAFQRWSVAEGFEDAAELIDEDWERMTTFYRFPKEHCRRLRTSNVVESPFAALRLRTDAAKRFKKVANATAVVWKMLMVAERRFRRLNLPELLPAVWAGQRYEDGRAVGSDQEVTAA